MLIRHDDGTFTGGPLDVHLILHNVEAGTYHVAFFEERMMPGPVIPSEEVTVVRLQCKMHHTTGAPTLEGAQVQFDEFAQKIVLRPENLWRSEPYPWDGQLGIMMIVPNWLRKAG